MFFVKEIFTLTKITFILINDYQMEALKIEFKAGILTAFKGMCLALQMSCHIRYQTRDQCKSFMQRSKLSWRQKTLSIATFHCKNNASNERPGLKMLTHSPKCYTINEILKAVPQEC